MSLSVSGALRFQFRLVLHLELGGGFFLSVDTNDLYLNLDSSSICLTGVLSQRKPGSAQPFASRRISPFGLATPQIQQLRWKLETSWVLEPEVLKRKSSAAR